MHAKDEREASCHNRLDWVEWENHVETVSNKNMRERERP